MTEPTFHPEGVYLGLSANAYLADAALGYTSIKLLKHDAVEYWERSPWNPIRPIATDDQKRGYFLGTAYHALQLEGLDTYEMAYGVVPTKEEFPDALDTNRELQQALRDRGLPVSGDKAMLAERLIAAAPHLDILWCRIQEFNELAKRPISRRDDFVLRRLHRMAMMAPAEIQLNHGEMTTLREAFTGGLSEVSVFWIDDNGIQMRARFDQLKTNCTIDLKTFAKWDDSKDFEKSLLKEIKQRGYWLQTAHYDEGRQKLREFVDKGLIFGGTDQQRLVLQEIADADEWVWIWILAKTTGAPRIKGIPGHRENTRFTKARADREEAIANFISYREQFGLEYGRPWIDPVAVWDPTEDEWSQADYL